MIQIRVRYFAVLRDRRRLSEEVISTTTTNVSALVRDLIAEHHLGLPEALIRVAIANQFVEAHHELQDGDECVLIPPVAGG